MLQKIGDWFRRLMYGRYGTDRLNMVLLAGALVCSLLSLIRVLSFLQILFYLLFFWSLFRSLSRNIDARQRENAAFTHFLKRFSDRAHRYYFCPSCGQTVRVPRGKGRISIRCPRCGQRFEKKT